MPWSDRQPDDPYLSVYLFPLQADRQGPALKKLINACLDEPRSLKDLMVEAIEYAESVARISPRLSKDVVYILPRALERRRPTRSSSSSNANGFTRPSRHGR